MLTNIFYLCKQKNINLSQLASRCGISAGYLSLIARGQRRNVSLSVLQRIAQELDVPLSRIISSDSPKFVDSLDNNVKSVLDLWQVPTQYQENFSAFIDGLPTSHKTYTQELFKDYYEYQTIEGPNHVMILVIAALYGGHIRLSLAERIPGFYQLYQGGFFYIDSLSSKYILKQDSSYIINTYQNKIPEALENFYIILREEMSQSTSLLHIGNISASNDLHDIAAQYYARAALSSMLDENRESLTLAVDAIKKLPESTLKSFVLVWQEGLEYSRKGTYYKGLEVLSPMLKVRAGSKIEREIKSRIASTVGALNTCLGKYKGALNFFQYSLRLSPSGLLSEMTLINIGSLYRRLGKLPQAKFVYYKVIESQNIPAKIMAFAGLAQIALDEHNLDDARRFLLSGYWLIKKNKNMVGREDILLTLGVYYKEIGKFQKAEELLRKVINRIGFHNNDRNRYYALLELSDLFIRNNQIDVAETLMNELMAEVGEPEETLVLGFWLNLKGEMYLCKSQPQNALVFLNKGYRILTSTSRYSHEFQECLRLLEKTHSLLLDPCQATFYREEYLKIRKCKRRMQMSQ